MTAQEKLTAQMIKTDEWLEKTILPAERAYIKQLQLALSQIVLTSKTERTRYRELETKIANIVLKLGNTYKAAIKQELSTLGNEVMYAYELQLATALLATTTKAKTKLSDLILNMDLPVPGINQSMNDLIANVVSYTNRDLRKEIGRLFVEGNTLEEITTILAKSYRTNANDSQAIATIRRNLRTTTNTMISITREQARAKAEVPYLKYISGWLYDAVRDSRTTPYCVQHDQRFYPKTEEQSTRNELEDANGEPVFVPHHYNCRSMIQAIAYD